MKIDLREKLTPAKKSAITRLYSKVEKFDSPEFKPIRVKRSTDTGERVRVKNTVFVATEKADIVRYNPRSETITKITYGKGTIKRNVAPLAPKPQNLEKAFHEFKQREKKGKKKGQRRYFMVRKAGASGTAGEGLRFTDLETLKVYTQSFRQRFLYGDGSRIGEIQRLRNKGMRAKDAEKEARRNAADIIEDWYIAEYEVEKE